MFFVQLSTVLQSLDNDDKIGCIVLTGSTRAFAGNVCHVDCLIMIDDCMMIIAIIIIVIQLVLI
jgi:hypothetical protein